MRTRSILLVAGVLLACAVTARGQSNLGTITGIVSDETGSVIPDAVVSVTQTSTGVVKTVTSNAEGVFLAGALVAGPYGVRVEFPGFAPFARDVTLELGQRLRLDVKLAIGGQVEEVTVVREAPVLERENAEIAKSLGSTFFETQPLKDRIPYNALALVPGVTARGSDPSRQQFESNVSFSGSRPYNNTYTIDGASVTHISGIAERITSIEALDEVKVYTNAYSAEFGRTSGGAVTFQTKSGTRQLQGSVYDYHRDSSFDATNWLNNATGVAGASLRRDEFGGTLGGPVPGLSQKMFFFFSYEGIRDKSPVNNVRTIPDARLRGGDFSSVPVVVYDPLTRQPFPGNVIPASRLDPSAQRFLGMLPAPNTAGLYSDRYGIATNNWIRSDSGSDNKDFYITRVDFYPGNNDRIFGTFSGVSEGPRDLVRDFLNATTSTVGPRFRDIKRGTLSYNRVINNHLTNETMATIQYDPRAIDPWYPDFDPGAELGLQRVIGPGMPLINVTGYGDFGNNSYQNWKHAPMGLSNVFTWLKGRHSLRFGAQWHHNRFTYFTKGTSQTGTYRFNGEATGLGTAGQNPINALADFLLGAVKTADVGVPQEEITRTDHNVGLFVNDEWKLSSAVSMNLGLRYEFETRPIVTSDVYSRIDTTTGQLLVASQNASRNLDLHTDFVNVSPRIGMAWSRDEKTVVRAGFAIFHATTWNDNGEMVSYPGWTNSVTFPDRGVGQVQAFQFTQGIPFNSAAAAPDPLALFAAATPSRPLPVGSVSYYPDAPLPYQVQWNTGVQRQLPFSTAVEVSYVGSRGVHLPEAVPANNPGLERAVDVVINKVPIQNVRPFPNIAAFNVMAYRGQSDYHSLQVKASRRYINGFGLDAAYTYSKYTDSGTYSGASRTIDGAQINWQYPDIEAGLSGLDRTHNFVVAWTRESPLTNASNRTVRAVFGNWQFNGIFMTASGSPFTILQNRTNTILTNQRPDLVAGGDASGRLAEPYFDGPALRYLVPVGAAGFSFTKSSNVGYGNLGRNTGRSPGYWNMDVGLARTFGIKGRVRLVVRADAYNLFNHPNFGTPTANIDSASYGLISEVSPPRQIQIGAKLQF